ncbi:MAG: hypothetical protein M1832_000420 [Thelocarpon impressellum]|nr:MAG: hypothetical protein M1832_000420 [Thelocarpon impressellum]
MADAISIEETNKIRVALGLKPLPVPGGGPVFKEPANGPTQDEDDDPGSTLESRQAAGYENYKKLQDEAEAKAKREAKKDAIKKARDASQRFARLDGKGLGDEDAEVEVDTKTWLLRQKKRQKKVDQARKLEQELAEREQQVEHTAADLAGVKVGHELGDIEEGGDQVLTLKDTTIDENEEEGDELENLELKEREVLAEKMELKKKKPVYNPNDMDDQGGRSLLGQYDEEIDGKKRKRFVLGEKADGKGADGAVTGKPKPKVFSLDLEPDSTPISDYMDVSEVKIRKPKKKKKSTRRKEVDEDDIVPVKVEEADVQDEMDLDNGPATAPVANAKKRTFVDASFVDDDDLQASLALQRRDALKKRKKMRPEDIARQMREEASATPAAMEANGVDDAEGGLMIDETSEFVANLQKPTVPERRQRSTPKPREVTSMARSESPSDEDGDVDMDMERSHVVESPGSFKRETSAPAAGELPSTGLEAESTLDKGIGATLSMLTSRGLLKPAGSEADLNEQDRSRARFLSEKHAREAEAERRARVQRERDRASGKLSVMSAREKEAYAQEQNRQRETYESRAIADVFARDYRPHVELKYTDEHGRSLGAKEAFKHLSHQFHGKGSGKQKTEKRIKKIEDEKRREAVGVLDASKGRGLNAAVGAAGKKARAAGVRLG